MKNIKKSALLMLIIFVFTFFMSCGTYNPALNSGDSSSSKHSSGLAEQPDMDDDPTNDFTVQLRVNEQNFSPYTAINVYWRDDYSIHIAPVDENGIARIDGLDGDYKVSLSAVPWGYAYDPNGYIATNDNRNIILDMYLLDMVSGMGTSLYGCYETSKTGVYAVTLQNADDLVYFQFAPQQNGTYTIESWVDIHEDGVSPICTAWWGGSSYKHSPYKVTDVGVCGSYTRNFIHTIEIANQNISSSGGSQTFTFAVSAETKNGVYPVTVAFAIKRNGDFDLEGIQKTMIAPKENLSGWYTNNPEIYKKSNENPILNPETLYPNTENTWVFDEDNYKLWKKSEGGDDCYHMYNPTKYANNNGYGPVLVAYITKPCRFLELPFTEIEAVGSKYLTVNGTENYKQFIEGFGAVASGGYYCVNDCPCYTDGCECHRAGVQACLPNCKTCSPNCTRCPDELYYNREGYAQWANSDGVTPVTEELKIFLQKLAISNRYFADGDGHVETHMRFPCDAYEDSQWLFACGYYANDDGSPVYRG